MSVTVRSETTPERRAPRWMWIALVVSLALNLLVAGVVVSAAWHLRHAGGVDGFGFRGRLTGFLKSLPPARSDELRAVLNRAQPEIRPLWREAWQERREAARLFAAEPFDREAFAAAHARVLDTEMKARKAHLRLITELAEELTADERQALLKWWGRRWRAGRESADAGRDRPRER
ncbi:MAG: periplasmic heavy metal sensor [Hyphomicrobiaceae bacterium]|nr:periplasmic heavy metal sensor [Hyphomicrobiaceae bacterium]